MDLFSQAKDLGILTEFIDGQGHRHVTDEAALKIIARFPAGADAAAGFSTAPVVIRSGQPARTELCQAAKLPLRWKIAAGQKVIAEGEARRPSHRLAGGSAASASTACSSPMRFDQRKTCR